MVINLYFYSPRFYPRNYFYTSNYNNSKFNSKLNIQNAENIKSKEENLIDNNNYEKNNFNILNLNIPYDDLILIALICLLSSCDKISFFLIIVLILIYLDI